MLKTPAPSPLVRVIDAGSNTFDKLYAPRLEAWFTPSPDGSPSTSGKLAFYTQWWHFRNNAAFAQSDGPRLDHEFDQLLEREYPMPGDSTISGLTIVAGVESVFKTLAGEYLATPGVLLPPLSEIPETQ